MGLGPVFGLPSLGEQCGRCCRWKWTQNRQLWNGRSKHQDFTKNCGIEINIQYYIYMLYIYTEPSSTKMNQHFYTEPKCSNLITRLHPWILGNSGSSGTLLEFDQLGGCERWHHVQEELGGLFPTPGNHEVDPLVDLQRHMRNCWFLRFAHVQCFEHP